MITNSSIKRMIAYFEAKENRSEEETSFLAILKDTEDVFIVSCVTRQDLEEQGYDATNVSDDVMERIARRMDESFCEDGIYWDSLECQADWYNVPLKD